jgi:hypothetical protein
MNVALGALEDCEERRLATAINVTQNAHCANEHDREAGWTQHKRKYYILGASLSLDHYRWKKRLRA